MDRGTYDEESLDDIDFSNTTKIYNYPYLRRRVPLCVNSNYIISLTAIYKSLTISSLPNPNSTHTYTSSIKNYTRTPPTYLPPNSPSFKPY